MNPNVNSRRKDLSESLLNAVGGYTTGFIIGIVILPFSANWIQNDPLVASSLITLSYASANFARSYFLRRFSVRIGIDDRLIKLFRKLISKV